MARPVFDERSGHGAARRIGRRADAGACLVHCSACCGVTIGAWARSGWAGIWSGWFASRAGVRRDGPAGWRPRRSPEDHGQRGTASIWCSCTWIRRILWPICGSSRMSKSMPGTRSAARDTGSPGSPRSSPRGPGATTSWPGLGGDEAPAAAAG